MRLFASLLALLPVAGCHCGSQKPEGRAAAPVTTGVATAGKAPTSPPLAEREFYRLELAAAPTCAIGTSCDVRIALTALGGHHINAEYPTKFVPVPAGELVVDSSAFTVESQTRGVMSVRITPASAGTHTLSGRFKLGVCTDNRCDVDNPTVELPIRVL